MVACFIAPFCDLCNQFEGKGFIVWKLHCSLSCPVPGQAIFKMLYSLISRIKANMLFVSREMDYISIPPICGHAPRNTLLCIGKCFTKSFPKLVEDWPDRIWLRTYILINSFRSFTTKMVLIFIFEFTATIWTFPHDLHYTLSLIVTFTLSPGCFEDLHHFFDLFYLQITLYLLPFLLFSVWVLIMPLIYRHWLCLITHHIPSSDLDEKESAICGILFFQIIFRKS